MLLVCFVDHFHNSPVMMPRRPHPETKVGYSMFIIVRGCPHRGPGGNYEKKVLEMVHHLINHTAYYHGGLLRYS